MQITNSQDDVVTHTPSADIPPNTILLYLQPFKPLIKSSTPCQGTFLHTLYQQLTKCGEIQCVNKLVSQCSNN